MSVWLVENWVTIVIFVILLVLVFFAVRSLRNNRGSCKAGGCDNCMGCNPGRNKHKKYKDQ